MKAFLFDMDGVLVDTEKVITKSAVKALKEFGVECLPTDFLAFTGMGEDRFIGGVSEKYGVPYSEKMKAAAYDIYDTFIFDEIEKYPSVIPVVKKLKETGFKLAVCSSADRRKVLINLKAAGIDENNFTAILSGSDVTRKKPFPDIFLKGAELLNVSPKECYVIEDALSGIKAAKAAGCIAIGITTSFSGKELKTAGTDFVINDIIEVLDLI